MGLVVHECFFFCFIKQGFSEIHRAKNTLLSVATTIRLGKQKESLSAFFECCNAVCLPEFASTKVNNSAVFGFCRR